MHYRVLSLGGTVITRDAMPNGTELIVVVPLGISRTTIGALVTFDGEP